MRLGERREHVEEQRLAERTGLLGPVEHGDALRARRQRLRQFAGRERSVEPELCHADSLTLRLQEGNGLARSLPARSHQHQHSFGLGMPAVVDQPVVAARTLTELVHRVLDGAAGMRA